MVYVNWDQFRKQLAKYMIEGLAVAITGLVILPNPHMSNKWWIDITMLALVAASTFAILDTYSPRIADGTRQGAGLGFGLRMAGVAAPI